MTTRDVRQHFDKSFFDRFYHSKTTAVVTRDDIRRLAKFVVSYLDYLRVPVDTVLDVGCGLGMWRGALRRLRPKVGYTGLDTSEYLCDRYGWIRSSIIDYRSRSKFDLVICQDMMQYIDDDQAIRSIEAIAALCRGAFYLDVLTKEDVARGALDLRRTDRDVHIRSAKWYLRAVTPHFERAGGGVFIPKSSRTTLLSLERG